jgi:tRNA(adenine34) deaminase
MFSSQDKLFMKRAIDLAKECINDQEVPVGAVIVKHGKIIGEGKNRVIRENDVTSHAEINAIRNASKNIKNYRLNKCSMYVTLEPCHMCAKAIVDARLDSLIFASSEPKTGSVISIDNFLDKKELNHKIKYCHGLLDDESSSLLKDFFISKR